MAEYDLIATVVRAVTDTITMTVEADDYGKALIKAERVLNQFPLAVEEEGVPYVYVEHRDYGEPHIMALREFIDEEE